MKECELIIGDHTFGLLAVIFHFQLSNLAGKNNGLLRAKWPKCVVAHQCLLKPLNNTSRITLSKVLHVKQNYMAYET